MKIAILSPIYPFRGGIAQFTGRLYTELVKNNEVKVYTFSLLYPNILFPGKTQYIEEENMSLQIDSIPVLNSINPLSYISTAKKINRFAPNVLIVPYWMSFLSPALGTVCKLINTRTKIIGLIHNAVSHEKKIFEKSFAKYFFNHCDGFIVMSEPVKKGLLSLIKDAKVLLHPHPIYDNYQDKTDKIEARKSLNLDLDKKTLLFFGFIRDYKGLDLLIEATNYLTDDFQLIIAGESYGSFEKYSQLIAKSPLRKNILVLEKYISDDMASILFSAADVLVLPYKSATQSGVIGMAYQLETPVIVTDVGALGETVRNAGTGIVANDISALEIANTVKDYFQNDRSEYFLKNIKSEKNRLSWASFVSSLQDFILKELS